MPRSLWEIDVTQEAESLIGELGIDTLPVCPFEIAKCLDIEVRPLPASSKSGVSGIFMQVQGSFGILHATYIDSAGFKRFSVAHELGHYRLPGHPEFLVARGIHESAAGFVSENRYELEADQFAAALLMPRKLFDGALDKAGSGLDGIESIATECMTSLTATAIRFAQRTTDAVAIVVSVGPVIDYCFMSESLREVPGLTWLRKVSAVPRTSITRSFSANAKNVTNAERQYGESTLQTWFGGKVDVEVTEEVAGLGQYGRTLTVLTMPDLPDPEEVDMEESLHESWTPKFRR